MAAVVYIIRVLILIIIFNDIWLVGVVEKKRGEVREKGKGKHMEKVGKK